jgi:hypothetical protein
MTKCGSRPRLKRSLATVALGLTIAAAPVAHADPDPMVGPAVGSTCAHYQQNTVTAANSGDQVRCVSVYGQGYVWLPDMGVAQQDPRLAAEPPEVQADEYAYCLQHFPRPQECHTIVYRTP